MTSGLPFAYSTTLSRSDCGHIYIYIYHIPLSSRTEPHSPSPSSRLYWTTAAASCRAHPPEPSTHPKLSCMPALPLQAGTRDHIFPPLVPHTAENTVQDSQKSPSQTSPPPLHNSPTAFKTLLFKICFQHVMLILYLFIYIYIWYFLNVISLPRLYCYCFHCFCSQSVCVCVISLCSSPSSYSLELHYRNESWRDPYPNPVAGCSGMTPCPLAMFTELVRDVVADDREAECGFRTRLSSTSELKTIFP